MSLNYVYEKAKYAIAKKLSLCYVRVRCPSCGMWTRLDNLKREQPLFEESTCYSSGDRGLFHDKKINPALKPFWIGHLKNVLARLGVKEKPYDLEKELVYAYETVARHQTTGYSVEKGVSYAYER